ncbi:GNA1162 family protein [Desulfovibrio ferrophilus]|uniref:Lipoprotein n=1 Tax=Desulfovibrio ferrophilus TaxID=241368 RepID=A0A2Z6AVB1_9BACT|nr:GNA1162 family protein [Desulfovibrio ferrophilus]BBD07182.1 lipoprotein [Desulfovibrio ferrophilus]
MIFDVLVPKVGVVCALLMFLGGCAVHPETYLREGLENRGIVVVAVFPFDNGTAFADASPVVTAAFVSGLMACGGYEVEHYGNVKTFLLDRRILARKGTDMETLVRMRRSLGVDAVLFGRVEDYGDAGGVGWDAVPTVAVSVRLVDARTGEILFMAQHQRHGDDYAVALDIGRVRTSGELARRMATEVVAQLPHGVAQ